MTASRRRLLALLAASLAWPLSVCRTSAEALRVIEARIEGRLVVRPSANIKLAEGERVVLRWISDEAVELHIHGYDLKLQLEPGKPATMEVEAFATGRFPVMSHGWGAGGHGHEALTYLEVHPR